MLWKSHFPLEFSVTIQRVDWCEYFITVTLREVFLTVSFTHFKLDNGVMVTSKTLFYFIIYFCIQVRKKETDIKLKRMVLENRVQCLGMSGSLFILQYVVIMIIIHSKYFPVSDWLKPHA